jgi:hypothetical protein
VRLVRLYVVVLGAGLLLDGLLLLVLDGLGAQVPVNTTDWRHNLLHLVWGAALLMVSVLARGERQLWAAWAALIFGTFYVALGVLGLTIDQPFGLQLGPGENAFHFIVGPLALVLGAWALRAASLEPASSYSAAPPAVFRSAPAVRRRARHRPGKARGRPRRR